MEIIILDSMWSQTLLVITDGSDDSYRMKRSSHYKTKKDDKEILVSPSSADIEDIVPFPSSSNSAIQDERMCLLSDKCTAAKIKK